jgi:hypothetical protein
MKILVIVIDFRELRPDKWNRWKRHCSLYNLPWAYITFSIKMCTEKLAWWCMSIISALRRLRQED